MNPHEAPRSDLNPSGFSGHETKGRSCPACGSKNTSRSEAASVEAQRTDGDFLWMGDRPDSWSIRANDRSLHGLRGGEPLQISGVMGMPGNAGIIHPVDLGRRNN
jgi:hypothetical protein